MKILSNKKYNDLISKQFRGIFADVNDDNLIRENGLLYGENKELKQEIERLNNIINELNHGIKELDNMFYETFRISQNGYYSISEWELKEFTDKLQELKGSGKE